jgi:soluble lytic murein transglycosylase-like protein
MQGQLSSSEDWFQDEEAAPTPGCLSVLLFPPFSALLFGSLLFFGLTQIRFASTLPTVPVAASGKVAPFFAPSVLRWETDILAWAVDQGLDPNLVATVMQIESCGDPRALSHAGASGLFQVMPYHFAEGENEFDPQTNADRGLSYLSSSLDAFANDASMALAGYNGGINGASQPRSHWAQETIDYQYWGENIYADAAAGNAHSPVLDEWMGAGGASLCAQAERSAMALH